MPFITPLPKPIRDLLKYNSHPGLALDKFPESWNEHEVTGKFSELVQKPTAEKVVQLSKQPIDNAHFAALRKRRQKLLAVLKAAQWTASTTGTLTLHLARASALENAGICLHPIYGFVYLPGSGLKGMARAYAETVAKAPEALIQQIFGNKPGEPKKELQRAGDIIFHDAWPEQWPRLLVDIVNNHHPQYYQNGDPPGDWENPVPVYFLAVAAGTPFSFALSKRRDKVAEQVLQQAQEWLLAALCHLGAGAKTAAGYGAFKPENSSPPSLPKISTRATFPCTLELVTPAFLAGANPKNPEDCDLRPATLRGLLRWWWRTMHAGYVDVETLARLEAALWGDTATGSAITLRVQKKGESKPTLYDKFAAARNNKLRTPQDKKTTQGLWYLSYGMHDGGKQRQYVSPGTSWKLTISVRDTVFYREDAAGKPIKDSLRMIDKRIVLDQAMTALWWLCTLGGVGSKSRKGFGCFAPPPEMDLYYGAAFVSKGKEYRQKAGIPEQEFQPRWAQSPSLRQMVDLGRRIVPKEQGGNGWIEIPLSNGNIWAALDWVGLVAQLFAKQYKHQREKNALGLPRRIKPPIRGNFHPGPNVEERHSSPVLYHLHREANQLTLRIAAFPAVELPNLQDSEKMLEELLRHFLAQAQGGNA